VLLLLFLTVLSRTSLSELPPFPVRPPLPLSLLFTGTWNITAVGFFYGQAKAIGGNQAANGAGWFVPQRKDIKFFLVYLV
jgi:hypothetical protein